MPTTYWAFPTQTFTAWDANGDPVAGAKASIFEAGTSTPLVVYTDTALATPHAVPMVADGNGVFAPIYISGPDEIKIDVTDASDVQLPGYPVDNITGTPIGGLAASAIVFAPTSTLAAVEVQTAIESLDTLTQRTKNRMIEAETAGSSDAYTLDAVGTITAYADGDIFVLRANRDNTGAVTLNVDSVAAKNWKRHDGTTYVAYTASEIRDGNHYWVEYDSTADEFRTIFEMRRPATQAEAEAGTAIAVAMDALRVKQAILALDPAHLTRGTPIATTSGTEHDFTSLAAGINRITVILDGVNLSGTDDLLIQLGDAGGFEATSYDSEISEGTTGESRGDGFQITKSVGASDLLSGIITLVRINANDWISAGNTGEDSGNTNVKVSAGRKTLSAELTDIRLTPTGSDTFDAGSVNIFTE